jgi:ATP-dependent DNA helicase RecG
MLKEELQSLIDKIKTQKCEEQTLELKAAKGGCPKLYETLSSFSNQNYGGIIVLGIDESNDYQVCGVYDPQDVQHKVSEQCKQMHPEVRPILTTCEIGGKIVISVEVPSMEISQRPVFYKGVGRIKGSYIRVGDADEPMTEYEVYSYEAYRKQLRDDIRPALGTNDTYLDKAQINRYLNELRLNRPNTQNFSDNELLELMGIIKDGVPTLTAILCFHKYPQAVYPQLCITAVLIPGFSMGDINTNGERFLANKKIEGTIHQMTEAAVSFVAMNMRERVAVIDGKRVDSPEYPLTAVREAILNSLVHRDYSPYTEGMPVRIEMYKDRLEITNAGGLYGAVNIDQLSRIQSDTRNKTIISVLETVHAVENRYSGIPTIRKQCRDVGLPQPIFSSDRGMFKVIMYNGSSDQNQKSIGVDAKILEFCQKPRTRKELSEYLGITQYYMIKKYIEPLIAGGKLAYTVPDKPKSKSQKLYTISI